MPTEIETEKSELVLFDAPELNAIEPSKAEAIKAAFEPMVKNLNQFEEAFNEITKEAAGEITGELTAKARRLRLSIAVVRQETEKLRKAQKEECLRLGKAIDGVANIAKWAIVDKEKKLKDIEDHFAIAEQLRIDSLRDSRLLELEPFIGDQTIDFGSLGAMAPDVFDAYLTVKKKDFTDREAAEVKAQADRMKKEKAIIAERKRLKEENAKLQKEKAERDKKAAAEKKTRDAAEAKRRAAEKEKLDKQKAKAKKAEAELKERKAAEAKKGEAEEKKKETDLRKGDALKVVDLIADLARIQKKYTFKSKKNKRRFIEVCSLIDRAIAEIK